MKLHSPHCERPLRRAARQVVYRSATLKREARLRQRRRWRRMEIPDCAGRLFWTAALVYILAGGVRHASTIEYRVAVLTLWALMHCLFQARSLTTELYHESKRAPFAFLPVADELVFRWQGQRFLWRSLACSLDYVAAYVFLAWTSGAGLACWVAAALCAVLQWLLTISLVTILTSYRIASLSHGLPIAVSLGAVFLCLAFDARSVGPWLASWLEESSRWLPLLLPTSWPPTLFQQVAVGGQWVFVLLLGPVTLCLLFGLERWKVLRGGYSFNPAELIDLETGQEEEATIPRSSAQVPGPTEIVDSIRARTFLSGLRWETAGPQERIAHRWLTSRERLLVEAVLPNLPKWSQRWQSALWWLAIGGALSWLLQTLAASWFGWVDGIAFVVAARLSLSTGFSVSSAFAGGLPVSLGEITWLQSKLAFARCLAALPFFIGYGAFLARRLDSSALFGAQLALKAILIFLSLGPVAVVFAISRNDTKEIRFRSLWLLLMVLGFGGVIVGFALVSVLIDFSDSPPLIGWACLAGAFFASWSFFALYRRQFNRCRFDLIESAD